MTLDELKPLLANQELLTGVVGILKEQGLVVRTTQEDAEFISNFEKNALPSKIEAGVEEKIKSRISEVATAIEKDVLESSDIPKKEGEKYYDYVKRVVGSLRENKGGDTEKLLRDRLAIFEPKVQELEQQLKEKDELVKSEILNFKKSTLIDSATSNLPIAYPAHLTTDEAKLEYKKTFERIVRSDFETKYKAIDNNGEIVFYEGDKPLLDASNAYQKPEAIIRNNYSYFIAPDQQPKGGVPPVGGQQQQVGKMTDAQFDEYAQQKGLAVGSRDWAKARSESVISE
jgi:hypothetical protein